MEILPTVLIASLLEITKNLYSNPGDLGIDDEAERSITALAFFRDEIEIVSKLGNSYQATPIFLGHGVEDEKVTIQLGRGAKSTLELLGVHVQMVEYERLNHWYSGEMLTDVFGFLKDKLKNGHSVKE